jgi:hypothetical protein
LEKKDVPEKEKEAEGTKKKTEAKKEEMAQCRHRDPYSISSHFTCHFRR